MPVRGKPKTDTTTKAMDEFITGGATSPEESTETGTQPVNLKIPRPLLKRIDKAVAAKSKALPIPLPRTHWIMEAIAEKLRREKF